MLDFLFTKTPLLYFVQSFWRDEAFTAILARLPISKIIPLTAQDFNPPLYYLFMHLWMKIFGMSEIALRSLSLLFYVGIVITVYSLFENVFKFSAKKSSLYLLLFFLNPLLLYNAFEARMYTMLAFFATLSWYFLKRGHKTHYIIATVLGLYTHYFMLLVVASQLFYVATSHFLSKKIKIKDYKEILICGVLFLPWILYLLTIHAAGQEQFWILPLQFDTYNHMPTLLYTGYEFNFGFFENYLWGITILLNIIPLYGLYRLKKQKPEYRDIYIFLSTWTFIPVFITFGLSLFKPLFLPRYLIASSVGVSLIVIYVLDEFPRTVGTVLTVIFAAYSLFYLHLHVTKRPKAPVKSVMTEIRSLAKDDGQLFVTNELDFFTAQYYFDPERVYIYAKNYEEIPAYTGKVLIPNSKIAYSLPLYPKKAFILNDDLTYTIQALY